MKLNLKDIEEAFLSIIKPEDDTILIYSGIWTFGSRLNILVPEIPGKLLDAILSVVGPNRTLMFPTYTYNYNRTRLFDHIKSKAETGKLAELFLARSNVIRTKSAINSYGISGPLSEMIGQMQGQTLWGEGSVMEWIGKNNVRICMVGLPWHDACSFYHYSEEHAQVPYRYYKSFCGKWSIDGKDIRPWKETMYVRPLGVKLEFQWHIIADEMKKRGLILSPFSHEIPMSSAKAKDILDVSFDFLRENPYAFIKNEPEVRQWVEHGKSEEIASGSG